MWIEKGTLGIAILSGILASLHSDTTTSSSTTPGKPTTDSHEGEETPPLAPTRFIACVRRPESAKRIQTALTDLAPSGTLKILQNENVEGAKAASVIILGCKPQSVSEILSAPGVGAALSSKLLISICAGVTVPQIQEILAVATLGLGTQPPSNIVRVMPNTAAIHRESMTVIATPDPPLPPPLSHLVTWLFTRIGLTVTLPAQHMDVSTALCGSGPAFLSLFLEALADGAVAMGLPRAEAQLMAAQTMRGTSGMVLGGEHPAMVREKVSTPGGCTIGGLLVLEEGRVRGSVARGVREATVVAAQLGSGVKGVNGTRF